MSPLTGLLTPLTYWVEASVLTSLVGGSFGQLVCGVRVVRLVGRGGLPLPLLPSLARHLLVCWSFPPRCSNPTAAAARYRHRHRRHVGR